MKKLLLLIIVAALLLAPLSGCGGKESTPPEEGGDGAVKITETEQEISIENDCMRLRFDKTNGSLISLYNVVRNSENLGTTGGNFTLYVDTATGDMWETKPVQFAQCQPDGDANRPDSYPSVAASVAVVSSRTQTVKSVEQKEITRGMQLTFCYDVAFEHGGKQYSGIAVRSIVSLREGEKQCEWSYEIENNCAGTVVMQFVAAQIEDVAASQKYSLFWPMHEGELHEDAVQLAKGGELVTSVDGFASDGTRKLVEEYPSHLSMSLVQLYNDTQSLFYYVTDDTNEYKQFNFGIFDGEHDYDAGKADVISLSVTQYPFVEGNGVKKELHTVHLGLGTEGDWYEGSDAYRSWKETTDIRSKSYMPIAETLPGYGAFTFKLINDAQPSIGYDKMLSGGNIASNAASFDGIGVDAVFCLGWMDEGFDSKYPDYNFNEAMGGESGMQRGIAMAHENGDQVVLYINLYAATNDSQWFNRMIDGQKQGDLAKVKSAYGKDYNFTWANGTDTPFYSICPGSQYFINSIAEAVEKVAKSGADGIFFDQLMEMSSNLCFDRSHGHSTPATAYGEGYDKLFTYIRSTMDMYSDNYFFSCEGICDAYLKYVDIPGLMWSRLFGWSDHTAPQITRYTLPTRIMGLPNFGAGVGASDQYARAFLMADPLRVNENNNLYAKKFIDAYNADPDVFYGGRYIDRRGIELNRDLEYGAIVQGNTLVVSVYNQNRTAVSDCALQIGIAGKRVLSAADTFTGETADYTNFSMEPLEVKSFKFTLEDEA